MANPYYPIAYLCCILQSAISSDDFPAGCNDPGIDIDSITYEGSYPLMGDEFGAKPIFVNVGLRSQAEPKVCAVEDGDNRFDWWRQHVDENIEVGAPAWLGPYCTIFLITADDCKWIATEVWISGAEYPGMRHWGGITVSPGGGDCPDDKEDVITPLDSEWYLTVQQNNIVPGDRLYLYDLFSDGISVWSREVHNVGWGTCCFTGGKITAVRGTYGDANIEFDVRCQGRIVIATPTDFVEWAVGDWVFMIQGTCSELGRDIPCYDARDAAELEQVQNWIILPLHIGSYGA